MTDIRYVLSDNPEIQPSKLFHTGSEISDIYYLTIQKSNNLDYIDRPLQILEMYCVTIQKSNMPGYSVRPLGTDIRHVSSDYPEIQSARLFYTGL